MLSTGEYTNTNLVTFGSSIAGTVNPVVYSTNDQFDVSGLILIIFTCLKQIQRKPVFSNSGCSNFSIYSNNLFYKFM